MVVGASVGGLVLDVGGALVVGAMVVGAAVVGVVVDTCGVVAVVDTRGVVAVVDGLLVADEQAVASSVRAAAPMSAVRVVVFMPTIVRRRRVHVVDLSDECMSDHGMMPAAVVLIRGHDGRHGRLAPGRAATTHGDLSAGSDLTRCRARARPARN